MGDMTSPHPPPSLGRLWGLLYYYINKSQQQSLSLVDGERGKVVKWIQRNPYLTGVKRNSKKSKGFYQGSFQNFDLGCITNNCYRSAYRGRCIDRQYQAMT
ncbi:hypothetical protein J6590_016021 [Homalodisca vitripennis]|nr:hypothetical protein J6590_016021 [Homalodisca vitripennis]